MDINMKITVDQDGERRELKVGLQMMLSIWTAGIMTAYHEGNSAQWKRDSGIGQSDKWVVPIDQHKTNVMLSVIEESERKGITQVLTQVKVVAFQSPKVDTKLLLLIILDTQDEKEYAFAVTSLKSSVDPTMQCVNLPDGFSFTDTRPFPAVRYNSDTGKRRIIEYRDPFWGWLAMEPESYRVIQRLHELMRDENSAPLYALAHSGDNFGELCASQITESLERVIQEAEQVFWDSINR